MITVEHYGSSAGFGIGIVAGSSPQMVKVGTLPFGNNPSNLIIRTRRPNKVSLMNVDDFVDPEWVKIVDSLRHLWEFTGRSLRDTE